MMSGVWDDWGVLGRSRMRIAIFGTGGVGGYFGGRLAESGEDVTFIARGKHLDAIRQDGLRVKSPNGDFVVRPAKVTDDSSTVGVVDTVLVAVKAWQVPEVAPAIKSMMGPETFVVPLQNGVDAANQLAEALEGEHVIGGLCKIISSVVAPGRIQHSGMEPYVAFGELDTSTSSRTERLFRAFKQAGVTVELPPDINVAIWKKFVLIASWSGMGALTRVPVGLLREVPETRRLLEGAMREIARIASVNDVELGTDIVKRTMEGVDGLPAKGTTSMQRDIAAGLPSELDSQNGAAVKLGKRASIETTVNSFIYYCLRPLELVARGEAA